MTDPTYSQVLQHLLLSAEGHSLFAQFLRKELSTENLDFFDSVNGLVQKVPVEVSGIPVGLTS